MKASKALALVAAMQLVAAPVAAASLEPIGPGASRSGMFAGARLRLTTGGRDNGRLHAGLGIAPLLSAQRADGRITMRIGDGLAFGVRAGTGLGFTVSGQPISNARWATDSKKGGVPTWVLIAGGALVALSVTALVVVDSWADNSE